MSDQLNLSDPILDGKYFETNADRTEFVRPPVSSYVVEEVQDRDDLDQQCSTTGCNNQVRITEEGNSQYAWYYLTNGTGKSADVTIERWWVYAGRWQRETVSHRLYPGERREVFSFPRNQQPRCCVNFCNVV